MVWFAIESMVCKWLEKIEEIEQKQIDPNHFF